MMLNNLGFFIISIFLLKHLLCLNNFIKNKEIKNIDPIRNYYNHLFTYFNFTPYLTTKDSINVTNVNNVRSTISNLLTSNLSKKYFKNENFARFRCKALDIYCLCKFHPNYKECVCLAYPKSVICSDTYCRENKKSYECDPDNCKTTNSLKTNSCLCKRNINHIKCKCKTNPLHRDCFCLQYPMSSLCNERGCKSNSNSLFCLCEKDPINIKCSPKYCNDNREDEICECLVFPLSNNCKCLNDPSLCNISISPDLKNQTKLRQYSMNSESNLNLTSSLNTFLYPNSNNSIILFKTSLSSNDKDYKNSISKFSNYKNSKSNLKSSMGNYLAVSQKNSDEVVDVISLHKRSIQIIDKINQIENIIEIENKIREIA